METQFAIVYSARAIFRANTRFLSSASPTSPLFIQPTTLTIIHAVTRFLICASHTLLRDDADEQ